MSGIAVGRLTEERKSWRKDHHPGYFHMDVFDRFSSLELFGRFFAKPGKKADNSTNIMVWETGIPGKEGTDWAGGVYKVHMEFPDEYPSKALIM